MPNFFDKSAVIVLDNLSAKDITTFRGGGSIAETIFPLTIDALVSIRNRFDFVIGRGSNLIISDGIKRITALSLKRLNGVYVSGEKIIAEAGASAKQLFDAAFDASLSGLEFIHQIPASVGGLVKMNAGAFSMQISDCLESCLVLKDGVLKEVKPNFGYRESDVDGVIVSATFKLKRADREEMTKTVKANCHKRRLTQPTTAPSCGSTFKNPKGASAGKLIEDCGLKGYSVGGTSISDKHCNFIVNNGGATASDFLQIVDKIEETVYYKYGIRLEREFKLLD